MSIFKTTLLCNLLLSMILQRTNSSKEQNIFSFSIGNEEQERFIDFELYFFR